MNDTLGSIIDRTGVDVYDYLDREELVPVLSGLQVQGDLICVPTKASKKLGELVPADGIAVIRGEVGGHTHLLIGEALAFAPATAGGVDLGVVTVPGGEVGYMAHPEHGYLAFGPGSYLLRRQREQADEIRLVQD